MLGNNGPHCQGQYFLFFFNNNDMEHSSLKNSIQNFYFADKLKAICDFLMWRYSIWFYEK